MPHRINKIKNWLSTQYGTIKSFDTASSDASFRRYFRVSFSSPIDKKIESNTSYIIMDAPVQQENIQPFIKIAQFLEQKNINVPHIYAVNEQDGFLLLGDLGTENYLDNLTTDNADRLYKQAISVLIKLQSIPPKQLIQLADYNSNLLNLEMDLFEQWYINVHLEKPLSPTQKTVLEQTLAYLTEQILRQPTAFVHRDFHSRNLMLVDNNNPGIIDFQDAVIGPCSYDLVSLLRDSYIAWPDEQIDHWVSYFYQQLISHNLIQNYSLDTFKQWFDFMGMQRQIKVVGIFSRLYHRDGKENYLNDIPQTLTYLINTSQKYPQFKEFNLLLMNLTDIKY